MCVDVCEAIRKKENDFMISSLFCPADISTAPWRQKRKKILANIGFSVSFFYSYSEINYQAGLTEKD